MRILYRFGQFWRALFDTPAPDDLELAQQKLSPPLLALFLRQSASEQAHSFSILRRLCEQGDVHEDLMLAALLHDVGKSRYPLHLWQRVLIVLAKVLFPQRAKAWGVGEYEFWKKPFVVAEQHAAWGAEMAERAGASALAVNLIRRHQDPLSFSPIMNDKSIHKVINMDGKVETGPASLEDELLYRLIILDDES
ncbi:HD domain-containing protein [Chloroflexota bacterium]